MHKKNTCTTSSWVFDTSRNFQYSKAEKFTEKGFISRSLINNWFKIIQGSYAIFIDSIKGTSINHVNSWGGGVSQMTILLHKPYLIKVTTNGEGVENTTWFMDDPIVYIVESYRVPKILLQKEICIVYPATLSLSFKTNMIHTRWGSNGGMIPP